MKKMSVNPETLSADARRGRRNAEATRLSRPKKFDFRRYQAVGRAKGLARSIDQRAPAIIIRCEAPEAMQVTAMIFRKIEGGLTAPAIIKA